MILICEPECHGFAHEEVNSAFVAAMKIAFPDEKMIFLGNASHIDHIKENLKKNQIGLQSVRFWKIKIPNPSQSHYLTFFQYYKMTKKIIKFALTYQCKNIIFLSIRSAHLYAVKLLQKKYREITFTLVIHGILEEVKNMTFFRGKNIMYFPFWFTFSLLWKKNEGIHYIVLSEFIRKKIVHKYTELKDKFYSIEHPFIFHKSQPHKVIINDKITFATLGGMSRKKGSHLFHQLVYELENKSTELNYQFLIIGIIDITDFPKERVYISSSHERLTRGDMDNLAQQVDYFLFFCQENTYEFMVSGAFFDALSYAKPIIALKNDMFKFYFSLLGDIGYLCDSYELMKEKIENILNEFPSADYEKQRKNIIENREKINIYQSAQQLKIIL